MGKSQGRIDRWKKWLSGFFSASKKSVSDPSENEDTLEKYQVLAIDVLILLMVAGINFNFFSRSPETVSAKPEKAVEPLKFPLPKSAWVSPSPTISQTPVAIPMRLRQVAESFFIEGEKSFRMKDFAKAQDFFRRARNTAPDDIRYARKLLIAEHHMAMSRDISTVLAKIAMGQCDEAFKFFALRTENDSDLFLAGAREIAQRFEGKGRPDLANSILGTLQIVSPARTGS